MKVSRTITLDQEVVEWLKTRANQSAYINGLLLAQIQKEHEPDIKDLEAVYLEHKEAYEVELKKIELKKAKLLAEQRAAQEKKEADEREARELEAKVIVDQVEQTKDIADELLKLNPVEMLDTKNIDALLAFVERFRAKGNRVGVTTLQKYIKIKLGIEY